MCGFFVELMEIIEPSIKLEAITQSVENDSIQAGLNVEKVIEKAGRTCFDQSNPDMQELLR